MCSSWSVSSWRAIEKKQRRIEASVYGSGVLPRPRLRARNPKDFHRRGRPCRCHSVVQREANGYVQMGSAHLRPTARSRCCRIRRPTARGTGRRRRRARRCGSRGLLQRRLGRSAERRQRRAGRGRHRRARRRDRAQQRYGVTDIDTGKPTDPDLGLSRST